MPDHPREWDMNLNPDAMSRAEAGTKLIEARLDKPKWRDMKIGDTIVFHADNGTPRKLRVEVVNLLRYPTFEELFTAYDPVKCNGKSKEEQLEGLLKDYGDPTKGYYTTADEEKYGVLGILMKSLGRPYRRLPFKSPT